MQAGRFRLRPISTGKHQESGESQTGHERCAGDTHIYSEQQKVPRQWKKFMSSGTNKEELMKFIFNIWRKADPQLLKGVEVFLAHEEKCHRLVEANGRMMCSQVEELHSDHEEADTRMIAHAVHASGSYPNVIIKSPDTDVLLIALNACLDIDADIMFETGVGTGRRIISLGKIRHSLGDQWCCSLIGLHAIMGLFSIKSSYLKHRLAHTL